MNSDQIFELALDFLRKAEGGFTVDSGGKTEAGVTQSAFSAWLAEENMVDAPVESISPQEVHDVYYDDFWSKPYFDMLSGAVPFTAIAVFDYGVNHSPKAAIRLFQTMIKIYGDGIIGSGTIHAATVSKDLLEGGDLALAKQFNAVRKIDYHRIAEETPSEAKYLKGWLNRCDHLNTYLEGLIAA